MNAPVEYLYVSSYVDANETMPDYGHSSPTAGNPAWPSIALLRVPTLVMDLEMVFWLETGSTHTIPIII